VVTRKAFRPQGNAVSDVVGEDRMVGRMLIVAMSGVSGSFVA
jgi:hypothetical protein